MFNEIPFDQTIRSCVLVGVVCFFVLRLFTKSSQISEFDDLGFLNLTLAFSAGMIAFYFQVGSFPKRGLVEIGFTAGGFYIGLWLTSKALNLKARYLSMSQKLKSLVEQDLAFKIVLGALFLFMCFGSGFAIFQAAAKSPDQRLLLAEKARIVDIFISGSSTIFVFILFVRILARKSLHLRWLFAPYIILISLLGAKSALINLFQSYLITLGVLRGKLQTWKDTKLIAIFGSAGVIFAVFMLYFYVGDLKAAGEKIMTRILLSGDVYLLSYVTADYRRLFNRYEAIPYLLHPFLRLIGLQGYEYPIGCALFELLTGSSAYGPNPHITIVSLVLTNGKLLLSALFCFCAGALVALIKYFSIWILSHDNLAPIWRLILFFGFFPCGTLFLDIGLFEQKIITVACVGGLLVLVYEVIGGKYRKSRTQKPIESAFIP